MKKALLSLFVTITFLGTVKAADIKPEKYDPLDCMIIHKGQQYVIKSIDAAYPEMVKDLSYSFKVELEKNHHLSLGALKTLLKKQITACDKTFPLFVEFGKFDRPRRIQGVIEGNSRNSSINNRR